MIDFVFPYVDNSDPIWQQKYTKYCEDNNITSSLLGTEKERFRDWGNLVRFVFRSIAKNMPWINNIFFIVQSESQVPEWLDKSKVKIIYHEDFIPTRYLPTYNSTTIEMFLWNIPGLGEQFIYGNDDLFALSPCKEEDFFSSSGLPKIRLYLKEKVRLTPFRKTIVRGMEMIHKDFPSIVIPENKYYRTDHLMAPMLKSTTAQVWAKHRIDICNNLSAFRTDKNVNQYIYTFYQVFSNQYIDVAFPGKYLDFKLANISKMCDIISEKSYKVICINDSGLNNEKDAVDIYNALQGVFDKKCKYELAQADNTSTKSFDALQVLSNSDFISVDTPITQLVDEQNSWSVKYIPVHKYPWLLSIQDLQYVECFTDTKSIKDAVNKLISELGPITKVIDDLEGNTMFTASNKFTISYDGFDVAKDPELGPHIIKNDKTYFFEDILSSFKSLEYIKSKLDTVDF